MSGAWYATGVIVVATAVLASREGVARAPAGDGEVVVASRVAAQQGAVAADTIEIRSEGPDLAFIPDRISVKQGTRLTIVYTNAGDLPHNFVLLANEDDLDTVGVAAFNAAETGYVPLEHKDKFLAYTALAKPGETVEVTFVVPPPGEYLFACLYPGHYNMMAGTLRSLN